MAVVVPSLRVDSQVALVTGCGPGIGRALALGLAAAGADVATTELPPQMTLAEETGAAIRALGREALALSLDVTDLDSIAAAVETVRAHFGRIDILVNNAGVNIVKPAFELTAEDWDLTYGINLRGAFFCSQAVARVMAAQGGGKIINVASQFGLVGYPGRAAYSASKGGLVNLTRTLAVEWGKHRIRVNAIAPTYTATVHNAELREDPDFVSSFVDRIPLGRLGLPEDLIGAVVYLASPSADMVTGQTLAIDGGWTAC
jgi:NAD(P)-dependent dehydrogenase (short-subunit alcohol dehydrogenase family)